VKLNSIHHRHRTPQALCYSEPASTLLLVLSLAVLP
jgi:hypothetical protein